MARALECQCGITLMGTDDEALYQLGREHTDVHHRTAKVSDQAIRERIASNARDSLAARPHPKPGLTGRTTRAVDGHPDAVFAKITDIAALPTWNAAMTEVCEMPGRLAPGAEWVVTFHALGQSWRSRSQCEVLDPAGRRFAYRSGTDDGNPSRARWEWTVTPKETGTGSDVEVAWELHPVTFWRRVLLGRVRAWQLGRTEIPASLAALAAAMTTA